MIALLRKPRWIVFSLLVVLVSTSFFSLGLWQLRRYAQKVTLTEQLERRSTLPPIPYADAIQSYTLEKDIQQSDAIYYRNVAIAGAFDVEREVLLRNRSLNGQPGYHLISPLVFADGRAVLVERGWVPLNADVFGKERTAPAAQELSIQALTLPEMTPATGMIGPKDPDGALEKTFYIDVERLQRQVPYRLEPLYLRLLEQSPPQKPLEAGQPILPVGLSIPNVDRGPHMSYAIQWFAFCTITLVGYILLLRSMLRQKSPSP